MLSQVAFVRVAEVPWRGTHSSQALLWPSEREARVWRLFLPKLGLGLGNPPSGMEEAREVMVGSHSPSGSVEIAIHPLFTRESSVVGANWTVPCLGQPRGADGAKHLHRLMGTFLEDLHRSARSIDLWDTHGLSPIFSAAVPLCNYQLHQRLELGTNEVLSATAESCTGEYRQQSSSALPCPASSRIISTKALQALGGDYRPST